jgi:hypothetical protein
LPTSLRSSEPIPVTSVVEEAGEVTVDAVVAAERQTPAPPFDFPEHLDDPRFDHPRPLLAAVPGPPPSTPLP